MLQSYSVTYASKQLKQGISFPLDAMLGLLVGQAPMGDSNQKKPGVSAQEDQLHGLPKVWEHTHTHMLSHEDVAVLAVKAASAWLKASSVFEQQEHEEQLRPRQQEADSELLPEPETGARQVGPIAAVS